MVCREQVRNLLLIAVFSAKVNAKHGVRVGRVILQQGLPRGPRKPGQGIHCPVFDFQACQPPGYCATPEVIVGIGEDNRRPL